MHHDIQSADNFVPPNKGQKSPAERYVDEINAETNDKYYTIRQVSEILGVHLETLRRVLRTEKVNAPTDVLIRGDWHIWLLTDEDLVELAKFYNARSAAEQHLREKFGGRIPRPLSELLKEKREQ